MKNWIISYQEIDISHSRELDHEILWEEVEGIIFAGFDAVIRII